MARSRTTATTLVAFVTLTAATVLLPPTSPARADQASDEARVVALVNQARAGAGAPALGVDPGLASVARAWAAKMAADGHISHNPDLATQVVGWTRLSENVGSGPTVDSIHRAFLDSPGHRANMLDTTVNAVGVGVAYRGGILYVVQNYARLATTPAPPPPPPNRAPAMPTGVTPGGGAAFRSSPTEATARYSDPDGTPGWVYFVVVDPTGRVLRQGWGDQACSGCVSRFSFPALGDGFYGVFAIAHDGTDASGWTAGEVFFVDRHPPRAPIGLTGTGNQVSAVYGDPDGTPGWVYLWLADANGTILKEGWSARTCSGCTATLAVPQLAPGHYWLWAVSFDGLLSAVTGPVGFPV